MITWQQERAARHLVIVNDEVVGVLREVTEMVSYKWFGRVDEDLLFGGWVCEFRSGRLFWPAGTPVSLMKAGVERTYASEHLLGETAR